MNVDNTSQVNLVIERALKWSAAWDTMRMNVRRKEISADEYAVDSMLSYHNILSENMMHKSNAIENHAMGIMRRAIEWEEARVKALRGKRGYKEKTTKELDAQNLRICKYVCSIGTNWHKSEEEAKRYAEECDMMNE